MIPGIEEIVDGLLAGQFTKAQAIGWLREHVDISLSTATLNIPALDRLVDLLGKVALKEGAL